MKKLILLVFIISFGIIIKANNIQITNVSVVPSNNTIKFDVSWDNGWCSNTLNNWDAAWLFFKYKDVNGVWQHMYLTNVGNIIPPGFTANMATSPILGVGTFLYRSTAGNGTTTLTNVELGIATAQATGIFDINAYGIEMVYIPQASFYVGDGVSDGSYFPITNVTSSNTTLVDPLSVPTSIISTTFPNGFNAFYCMKYELSQGGYRDFLNSLTYNQQVAHIVPLPTISAGSAALVDLFRNIIRIKTPGVIAAPTNTPAVFGCDANNNGTYDEPTDGEWIACNYLSWVDHSAYLYWAGLRPLTELEFEKSARGILLPVPNEYAWGNSFINTTPFTFSNLNEASEIVTNAASNPFGNSINGGTIGTGPVRNGMFATATSNRISSGAGFYGVMELTGNLLERVVTTRNTTGLTYKGDHGSGVLSSNGFAGNGTTNIFWPNINTSNFYVDGTIISSSLIDKGGGAQPISLIYYKISDRYPSSILTREYYTGIRGCRTSP
jgi:formylglycine-generating enzyme required for sulfatase activity